MNLQTSISKRKKSLGLVIAFSAASFAFAQEKMTFSGKIVDKNNNPVPYASVSFYSKSNKLVGDATLTDEKGHFSLNLTPGMYLLTVEAVNFITLTTDKPVGKNSNLGNIQIESEGSVLPTKSNQIEGVTITAQRKQYSVELDKKTYAVEQDLTSKGGTLQDVLQNVPSVSVETDGTVSMRGNSNVKFLINGKPSSLLGIDDDANALQSIPAEQIDRIEVITNPSSKFESSGTAGILNIILKKTKKLGFNGSVQGTLGYLPTTRLNTNLSWKKGSLVYYINGGGGYSESEMSSKNNSILRSFDSTTAIGKITSSNQNGETNTNNSNYNVNTGIVYDFNDKTSINLSGLIRTYEIESDGFNDYIEKIVVSPGTTSDSTSKRKNEGTDKNTSYQADLGLDHKFNNLGHQISVSGSFQYSEIDGNSSITEERTPSMYSEHNIIDKLTKNTSYVAKIDYELPIGEKSKLEAGARMDDNKNDYDYDYFMTASTGAINIDNYMKYAIYKENISAVYAQFKSKLGEKFGYQLGLRTEFTDTNLDSKSYDPTKGIEKNSDNYTKLFPSVFLSYDINKNNQFLANYSRRIRRPRPFFLIPFNSNDDNRNIFTGSPTLNPSYVDSFELGYSLQKSKFSINPTLYYRKVTDDIKIYQKSFKNSSDILVTESTPVNLGTQENYGMDINTTYNPFKWWRIMANLDLYGYSTYGKYQEAGYDEQDYEKDGFSTRVRLSNTFRPNKTTSFQIQAFYRAAEKTGVQNRKDMYVLSLGGSKTIMKGDATISFNIQDVLNTRKMKMESTVGSYFRDSERKMHPRQFSVSFTYNFRQGDKVDVKKPKKEINSNDTGGNDE